MASAGGSPVEKKKEEEERGTREKEKEGGRESEGWCAFIMCVRTRCFPLEKRICSDSADQHKV